MGAGRIDHVQCGEHAHRPDASAACRTSLADLTGVLRLASEEISSNSGANPVARARRRGLRGGRKASAEKLFCPLMQRGGLLLVCSPWLGENVTPSRQTGSGAGTHQRSEGGPQWSTSVSRSPAPSRSAWRSLT